MIHVMDNQLMNKPIYIYIYIYIYIMSKFAISDGLWGDFIADFDILYIGLLIN